MFNCQRQHKPVEQSMNTIKERMINLYTQMQYQDICSNYRVISNQLAYFINCFRLAISNGTQPSQDLMQCMKMVLIIVQSTQLTKYGNKLPLLDFLIKRFKKLLFWEPLFIDSKKVVERIIKNQQCSIYIQYRSEIHLNHQLRFLQSTKIKSFFQSLHSDRYIFQDSQCICCSKVFIEGQQIYNHNPYFSTLVFLKYPKEFDRIGLQKYLTAVCNSGGGVVLVGPTKKNSTYKAKPIKCQTQYDMKVSESLIYNAVSNIKPGCYYLIQKVLVGCRSSYIEQSGVNFVDEHIPPVIFRICIYPQAQGKLCYFQDLNCGEKQIQFYILGNDQNPQRVNFAKSNPKQNPNELQAYKLMHQRYNSPKNFLSSHPYIQCYHTEPPEYLEHRLEKSMIRLLQKDDSENHEDSCQEFLSEEPIFKYDHACLLVVSCKSYIKNVAQFCEKLKELNEPFDICRPFENDFRDQDPTTRHIWLITSRMDPKKIRALVYNTKQSQDAQKAEAQQRSIKIMPIQKTLQVNKLKMSIKKQKKLNRIFLSRYKQRFQTQQIENKQGCIHYHFNDFGQCIFAYLVLEMLQIRAYFVNQGKLYKKKSKI